jgi:hypothetical protein
VCVREKERGREKGRVRDTVRKRNKKTDRDKFIGIELIRECKTKRNVQIEWKYRYK